MPFPRDIFRGDSISASDWRLLLDVVQRVGRMQVEAPLEMLDWSGGSLLRVNLPGFYGKLTATGSANGNGKVPYAWSAVDSDGAGGWTVRAGGGSGSVDIASAFEENGATATVGNVYWLRPGNNHEFLFAVGSGSSGSGGSSIFPATITNAGGSSYSFSQVSFNATGGYMVSGVSGTAYEMNGSTNASGLAFVSLAGSGYVLAGYFNVVRSVTCSSGTLTIVNG